MILKTLRYELAEGIATITFDEQGSPVNTMCQQWQQDLAAVTAQLLKDIGQVRGVMLASAKTTFFAGADLKAVMCTGPDDGPRFFQEIEAIKRCFRQIETQGVPVVTCINGAALGGGLEVALVGHHRIAVNNPKILLGFPEVNLGLMPGAGGITKFTRLLGLLAAQPYLLECKLFNPQEAHQLGVVHQLVDNEAQLRERALAFIEDAQGQPEAAQHVWDRKGYSMPGVLPSSPKLAGWLSVAPAVLKQKTRGLYPAPEAALAAMVEGALVDFDTAMRIESRHLASLMRSQVTRNMINTFFFNMNAMKATKVEAAQPAAKDAREDVVHDLVAKASGNSKPSSLAARGDFFSRLLDAYLSEAKRLLEEGVPAAAIDNLALQAGMAVAPLVLLDATSPSSVQAKTSAASLAAQDHVQDIKDRLLIGMAVEAARCLNEGAVHSVAQANLASIFGLGFPSWAGGALQFIYGQGISTFEHRCHALAQTCGAAFALSPEIIESLRRHQPVY